MRQLLATPILALALIVALGSTALADPVPASMFGGTYFAMSEDHTAVAFKMADGHLRWEVNGVPISNYGVDDVARAASIGYDNATVLVLYGRIRGTYFGASQDGSVMGFLMPDGTTRWELNGVPAGAR